jgi:hypothetical protein
MNTEWKAIIGYGAGYRVEDENGEVVSDGLNSHYVIQDALKAAKGRRVTMKYYTEEVGGLEPCRPFGPEDAFGGV